MGQVVARLEGRNRISRRGDRSRDRTTSLARNVRGLGLGSESERKSFEHSQQIDFQEAMLLGWFKRGG